MSLLIRNSKIHGSGCYTTAPIKKGTFIVEYTGPRLTKKQADAIYATARRTYLFGLDDGKHVIDGDGLAAFINHCCDPNCEPDEIKGRVGIIAKRDIAAGEELSYDYNLYDGDLEDKSICHCGAAKCRGSMYSEEELELRAKRARRKSNSKKKSQPQKNKQATAQFTNGKYVAERRKASSRRHETRMRFSSGEVLEVGLGWNK